MYCPWVTVCWQLSYLSCVLLLVSGNVSEPSDGHAAVPRWRLQRGSAGGEKTLLFPSRQTLHVLLPDRLLSRQGTEHHHAISDLFFLRLWWCQVFVKALDIILFNPAATTLYSTASGGTTCCVTMVMEKLCTNFTHFPLLSLMSEQARDILMEKLSSWQDQCTDATEMPDSVLTMIEGLRTAVPITPLPSPSLSRHSVVRRWPSLV